MYAGVDRSIFAAALARRLRAAGINAPLGSSQRLVEGLGALETVSKPELYWLARISLVGDRRDLDRFDRLFAALFDSTLEELKNVPSRRRSPPPPPESTNIGIRRDDAPDSDDQGLPWATLPTVTETHDDAGESELGIPELTPAALAAIADLPFDALDARQLLTVGRALDRASIDWPRRRARRSRRSTAGPRVDLRETARAARRTAGEPMRIHRARPRVRYRRVVFVLDVSASMQSFVHPYLHLARGLARADRAEVFAVGTSLHRITAALRRRSAAEAIDAVSAEVEDRYGGTRLATNLGALLGHGLWGGLVRGSVIVIASDGWDSGTAESMRRQMARLARRSHRIVWVNPRRAADDFEPLVASMAAALPFCDAFLPGHSLAAVDDVIAAICADP